MEQQDIRTQPRSNDIIYNVGWLTKNKRGTLQYNPSTQQITLTDKATLQMVFTRSVTSFTSIQRAENALYFRFDSKTVGVSFGNLMEYMLRAGASMNLGAAGTAVTQHEANSLNQKSGIDDWVALLQQLNVSMTNFSPNRSMKLAFIIAAIVIGLVGVVLIAISIGAVSFGGL